MKEIGVMKKLSQRIHNLPSVICSLVFFAALIQPVHAQDGGDVESIITTTLASFAFIILSIIAIIFVKRISGKRRDSLYDSTGLDLMSLRSKGLLTPEEMEKVSKSIARRLEEKEAERRKAASRPTPEALLSDPEVARLRALAEAKEAEQAKQAKTTPSVQEVTAGNTPAATATAPIDETSGNAAQGQSFKEKVDSDVELPPEVQQLADAGVLTPEEIENVKRRLRERNQSGL